MIMYLISFRSTSSHETNWSKLGWEQAEASLSKIELLQSPWVRYQDLKVTIFACPKSLRIYPCKTSESHSCVRLNTVLCEDVIFLKKFLWAKENFFLQDVQINLSVNLHAFINENQRSFPPLYCNDRRKIPPRIRKNSPPRKFPPG